MRRLLAALFPTLQLHNSRTVRYAFSFLFLFATILGMAAVATNTGSAIRITSSATSVEEGQTFSIDISVYASQPVNAVDLAVSFDPNQVEVLGIDRGQSVLTLWTEDPRVDGSSIILRGGTYKKGFVGEHKIATINVKAKATGITKFLMSNVRLLAGDGKGSDVSADTSNAVVSTDIVAVGDLPATTMKGNGTVLVATDVDGDGQISLRDISSFMASWATRDVTYDFNNDGVMSFKDFSILLSDYFTHK
jgi:hypothetical protein